MPTDEQITALRAKHVPHVYDQPGDCTSCYEPFPCSMVEVLDELERARVAMRLAEEHGRTTITELNQAIAENERLKVDQQRWIAWKAVRDETEDELTDGLLKLTQANHRLAAELAQQAPGWESPAVLQEAHNASLASEEDKEWRLDAIHALSTGPLPMAVVHQITELASWRPSTSEPADEPVEVVLPAAVMGLIDGTIEIPPPVDARALSCQALTDIDPDVGVFHNRPVVGYAEEMARRTEDHVFGCELIGCMSADAKLYGSIVDDEPELASCNVCNATIQLSSGSGWEHQVAPAFVHDAEPHQGEVTS